MRDRWYADNRDLIKWGVLFRLAEKYEAERIIHVVYYRPSIFAQIEIDGERFGSIPVSCTSVGCI